MSDEYHFTFKENTGSLSRTIIPVTGGISALEDTALLDLLVTDQLVLGALGTVPTYVSKSPIGLGTMVVGGASPNTAQRGQKWLVKGTFDGRVTTFTIGTANAALLPVGSDTLTPSAYTALTNWLTAYGWTTVDSVRYRNYSIQ